MTIGDAIEAYLAARKAEGYATMTLYHARSALREFGAFARTRKKREAAGIDQGFIEKYLSGLFRRAQEGEYKAGPGGFVRRHAGHIRGFFRWAVKTGLVLVSPMDGLLLPRAEQRLPRDVLTRDEVRRLLDAPDTNEPLGIRDRAILELLYSSGMRRAEAVKLDLGDLDLRERSVRIREGKGRKDRVVPIGPDAAEWLSRYLTEARPLHERDSTEQSVFLTVFGARLKLGSFYKIIEPYRKRAKIEKSVTPHTLRHTCATHLVQEGADIRYVQQLLGHEYITTTQIYTRVAVADLKEAHSTFHPRRRLTGI